MENNFFKVSVVLAALAATVALGASLYLSFYGNISDDMAFLYLRISLIAWVNLTILAFFLYWRRRIFIVAPVMLLIAWFIYLYHDCAARNVCP